MCPRQRAYIAYINNCFTWFGDYSRLQPRPLNQQDKSKMAARCIFGNDRRSFVHSLTRNGNEFIGKYKYIFSSWVTHLQTEQNRGPRLTLFGNNIRFICWRRQYLSRHCSTWSWELVLQCSHGCAWNTDNVIYILGQCLIDMRQNIIFPSARNIFGMRH